LDVTGAAFEVGECIEGLSDGPITLTAWPSPAVDHLFVEVTNVRGVRAELSVWSMQGSMVVPSIAVPDAQRTALNVAGLENGNYILRLIAGDKVITQRFVRMDQ
jgi:hypothetical protein